MDVVATIHEHYVFERRTHVLARHLAALIPEGAQLLDVGCGDGQVDRLICDQRPDLRVEGIDIMARPKTHIPVTEFDGQKIPFADKSFDAVMFVDVLHHTEEPEQLLAEAKRVARRAIVIKDHCRDGVLAGATLRLMDWVGNAHHGVVLPYNYWQERRWREALRELDLSIDQWQPRLGLYPWPFSLLFDRRLHFVARLRPD